MTSPCATAASPAVQGISLEVGEGEIVGLVGPNGAGKSTTLAAVLGLVPVAAGRIAYRDASLVGLPPERIARRGIALVLEGRHVFATLTVRENLLLGRTASRDRTRADEALERVLERFPVLRRTLGRPAGALSGGEQQQLAIARALVAEPRLLLLDEPSLGLAPQLVDRVFEAIEEIRGEGVTVLLVEQNVARTVELADRTYVLRTGRIALSGTRAELARRGRLDRDYLGCERADVTPAGAVTTELVVQHAIDAAALGSLYALFALGVALIFGIMRLINFAHGELVTAGAYALVLLPLPVPLRIPVALALVVALALAMERIAFRPVRDASPATLLITSFALSFLLQNLAALIWGSTPRATDFGSGLGDVLDRLGRRSSSST